MESSSQTCPGTARDQPPVSADIPSILCIVAAGLNTGLPSQTIPGPTAGSNGYRTIKEATVKRFFAKRLKTLNGLTPYEYLCQIWTQSPDKFTLDPIHQCRD